MNKRVLIILSVFLLADILLGLYALKTRQPYMEVVFFDVGQGDSIFIETASGQQILLDGGPDSTVLEKLEKEMPLFDRTIDLVILSHFDTDHLTGLLEVLKRYEVKNVLWNGAEKESAFLEEWNRLLSEEGANVLIAKRGLGLSLGEFEYIEVLYPLESIEGELITDINNSSVVFKLVYGETSFLFPGDIYKETEGEILAAGLDLDADILKAAHHGSKTSTGEDFLLAVSPNAVVASCGAGNSYGHPHPEFLELLEKYGISIFRTDLKGDIKLISDKNKIYGVSSI
ncbi:MAG: ComEC/Rec2 family competence protein [Candidatus Paceibacterota bacterium]|jgi:competence protein ComEC